MNKVVIFGISKYTDLVEHYFDTFTDYKVCGYTVNEAYLTQPERNGKPVVAFEKLETFFPPEEYLLFIALGSNSVNTKRKHFYLQGKQCGYHFASFIHPRALIDPSAKIGEHCIIMENVVIQAFCEIGENTICFPSAAITHHTSLGAHSFVASGSVVGGCSKIGERAFIGISAVVNDRADIGDGCFIASGSVVTKKIEDNSFVGRDSKIMKINERSIGLLDRLMGFKTSS